MDRRGAPVGETGTPTGVGVPLRAAPGRRKRPSATLLALTLLAAGGAPLVGCSEMGDMEPAGQGDAFGVQSTGTGGMGTGGMSGMGAGGMGVGGMGGAGGDMAAGAGGDLLPGGGGAVGDMGAGGTGGADADGGAGGQVVIDEGGPLLRPCVDDGSQVVVIGDSYCNYAIAHRPLVDFLEERARPAGALSAFGQYRDYSVAGTTMASGTAAIPGQWRTAKAVTPVHLVVMTGGGNDVLVDNPNCRPEGSENIPACQEVAAASLSAAEALWADMQASGVTDVIYFWYPHIPGGLLTGYQSGTSLSDYAYANLEDAAAAASGDAFHVHMLPTTQIFAGHPEYFASDGLHANDTGEGKIADAIWDLMADQCIGQAADSGCCAP